MKDEINLLPPLAITNRVRDLVSRRWGRLMRTAILVGVLGVGAGCGVYGVYFSTAQVLNQELQAKTQQSQDVDRRVRQVNQFIGVFWARITAAPPVTPRLPDIFRALPPEVRVRELARREEDEMIVIRGVSSSGPAVVLFQERLKALSWVHGVEAPLKNFATETQGEFSLLLDARQAPGEEQ